MALEYQAVKYFLARRAEIDFRQIATLGRLQIYLDQATQREMIRKFHLPFSKDDQSRIFVWGGYAEPFFKFLGAREIISIDASDYEGATIIHDLNLPIPSSLYDRFTLVIDAGTLEHVFNFPKAIQNCMKMVKMGGQFISITTANNFMGHGFYQFSPELFFRVFSAAYGFKSEESILCELKKKPWYRLTDPAVIKRRVELTNSRQTYLIHRARRVGEQIEFSKWPQQSDYEQSSWIKGKVSSSSSIIKRSIPMPLKRMSLKILTRVLPPFHKQGLKRIN